MAKTARRKLYGSRRRRQRGGGRLWWVLFGALAALKGTHAEDASLHDLVNKWWTTGGWDASKALADRLAGYVPTEIPAALLTKTDDPTAYAPPPLDVREEVEPTAAPYLDEVSIGALKYGPTYEYEGKQFTVETWRNKGDTAIIDVTDGEPLTVPIGAKFKVVSVPSNPDDDVYGGRRRKRQRKTLRRKK